MEKYKDFSPTQFDCKGLCADRLNIGEFFVAPVSRNRDSDCLSRSNFRCCLKALGGESETVQVHRFGHWANGWFELILINPEDIKAVKIAEDIESALTDYPVLDDEDYSSLEWQEAADNWAHMSLRFRYDAVKSRYGRGISIFSIRRDELPDTGNNNGDFIPYLAGSI